MKGTNKTENGTMNEKTANVVAEIELSNNAYVISNAGGVVVFAASHFAAKKIAARSGYEAKLLAAGNAAPGEEPEPNTFAIVAA